VTHEVKITDPDTFQDNVVSGNSVFDPLTGLGSDQPAYFDSLASLWGRYRVLRSRMVCKLLNLQGQGANSTNYRVVICPRTATTVFSNIEDMMVAATAKWKVLDPTSAGNTLMNSYSTSQAFGLGDVEKTSESVSALVTANPTSEWFWHFAAQTDQAGTSLSVTIAFELYYEVEFFARVASGETLISVLTRMQERREEYLKLKAMTPKKDGRIPPKDPYDDLRAYVEGDSSGLRLDLSTPVRALREERKALPLAGRK
jgi:hypothetical protein